MTSKLKPTMGSTLRAGRCWTGNQRTIVLCRDFGDNAGRKSSRFVADPTKGASETQRGQNPLDELLAIHQCGVMEPLRRQRYLAR
jgi:hypothetical protein